MAKKSKARSRKRKAAKDLTPRNARAVKGGGGDVVAQKAGKDQHDYLVVKLADIIVTGVSPSGAGDGTAR
jgi:hypothetical protein